MLKKKIRLINRSARRVDLLLAAGLIISLALIIVAAGSSRQPGDLELSKSLQSFDGEWFAELMRFGDWIGEAWRLAIQGLLLLSALLILRKRREAGFLLAISAFYVTSPLLKIVVDRPRPHHESIIVHAEMTSNSFPSGHAFGAIIIYVAIFMFAGIITGGNGRASLVLRTAAVFLLVIVALSRIYLGAHWPSDVIGGLVISATGVALIHRIGRWPEGEAIQSEITFET